MFVESTVKTDNRKSWINDKNGPAEDLREPNVFLAIVSDYNVEPLAYRVEH